MKSTTMTALALTTVLTGCASLFPPSADKMASLPVVTYPAKPTTADYIYKLPAGQPIEMNIKVEGSALSQGTDQTIGATLARDLYLHKTWASEDGRNWQPADKLVGINLTITLPSYEFPGPGEIHLTVDRLEE